MTQGTAGGATIIKGPLLTSQLLNLRSVNAAYGKSQVLWDIAFDLDKGDSATVLGRNGVGKTTLMKTIMGQVGTTSGHVYWHGDEVTELGPHRRARAGIGFVPQGRHVFPHLTVRENLEVGLSALQRKGFAGAGTVPEMVFELFPKLSQIAGRKAGVLSGGEQQQLAIGRALAGQPELLLLDEPTEGIQPNIVQQIEDALLRVRKELGVAILIVEQNLDFAWSFAERFFVMQRGRIVKEGRTGETPVSAVTSLIHV
jgi:urea transport system ATP-binding protein